MKRIANDMDEVSADVGLKHIELLRHFKHFTSQGAIIWLGCLTYFLIGLATVIFGSLLPELLSDYGLSYSGGGHLVFAQFAGFLAGVLITPICSQRFNYQRTIIAAIFSLVIVHTTLYFHPAWTLVLILAAINGLGFGMAQAAVGTMLLETSIPNKAVMMSRLEVSFGIGALVMPTISSFLIAHQIWVASFAVLALLAISMTIAWTCSIAQKSASIKTINREQMPSASIKHLNLPRLAIFSSFVFLYVGIETSIINFFPAILVQRDELTTSNATLSVTFFWIAMVIGRLFSGVVAEKLGYYSFLLYSSLGGLLFLIGIAVIKGMVSAFTLVFIMGLFLSGIFAINIVLANQVLTSSTKQTTSMLIAAGGIGGSVLPLLIGWSMDHFQATVTVWLLVGCSALMFLLLLIVPRLATTSNTSKY